MRSRVVIALAALAVAACGGSAQRTPPPELQAALDHADDVIRDAAQADPQAGPGFKLPASSTAGLDGDELWSAVVGPMIRPLAGLTPTARVCRDLNPAQCVVYVLFSVYVDIEDGGIEEVYVNSSGAYAEDAVTFLRAIGAPGHARVLARANRLRAAGPGAFAALDDEWDALPPLAGIVARYIRSRPADFFS